MNNMINRQLITVSHLELVIPIVFFGKIEFLNVRRHVVCCACIKIPRGHYSEGDVELSDIGLSLLVERVGTSAWEICLIFLLPEINGFVIRFGI